MNGGLGCDDSGAGCNAQNDNLLLGKIMERGSHDVLIARRGLYADLHRRQQLEQEITANF
jgi:hypothetical protein